jgi:hypothetical protein
MKVSSALLALLLLVSTACSPRAGSELSRHQATWHAAGIDHYRFDLHVGCFCVFSDRMPLSIEVLDGRAVSIAYNDGTPVPAAEQATFASYATIDALFTFTADAISRADEIKVSYDPQYGFPSDVQIDFARGAADDELTLSVTSFEALP